MKHHHEDPSLPLRQPAVTWQITYYVMRLSDCRARPSNGKCGGTDRTASSPPGEDESHYGVGGSTDSSRNEVRLWDVISDQHRRESVHDVDRDSGPQPGRIRFGVGGQAESEPDIANSHAQGKRRNRRCELTFEVPHRRRQPPADPQNLGTLRSNFRPLAIRRGLDDCIVYRGRSSMCLKTTQASHFWGDGRRGAARVGSTITVNFIRII